MMDQLKFAESIFIFRHFLPSNFDNGRNQILMVILFSFNQLLRIFWKSKVNFLWLQKFCFLFKCYIVDNAVTASVMRVCSILFQSPPLLLSVSLLTFVVMELGIPYVDSLMVR